MPRIFIALPMDPKVRSAIVSLPKLRESGIRWVNEHQYHITLKFLGEITEAQLRQACDATDSVVGDWSRAIHLGARGVGAFPNMQRARVVWVGLTGDTEPLAQLQRHLDRALVDLGFEAEGRPFKPHVTIGRLKVPGPVPQGLQTHSDTFFGEWTVPAVQVIESKLRPSGPIYTVRHEVALPGS